MPAPTTNFLRTGLPDPRLAQTAATPFDATARQVLDQQVVDVQTILAQLQVNGVLGSYVLIDPTSSVDVAKGDVLCRSAFLTRNSALVATPAHLSAAGGTVLGVALEAAAKGSRCPYAVAGVLPPELTGLTPAVGIPKLARVSASARVEAVDSLGPSDTPLGGVDSTGWLSLSPNGIPQQVSPGIFTGTLTTTDATPTPLLTVPLSDNALVTGTFHLLTYTPPFGTQFFQASVFGYTLGVIAGVLQPPVGTPTEVSTNAYMGSPPTFDASYASNVLTIVATGIAATTIHWSARLDAVRILT